MITQASMYWLKPLVLTLALAVMAHANCAVSCVHPHDGKAPPENNSQSPEGCHHSKPLDKSDSNESGSSTCSHSQLSGDRPAITAQDFRPLPAALPAVVVTVSSDVGTVPGIFEAGPKSHASAPPITFLRI